MGKFTKLITYITSVSTQVIKRIREREWWTHSQDQLDVQRQGAPRHSDAASERFLDTSRPDQNRNISASVASRAVQVHNKIMIKWMRTHKISEQP